MTLCAMNSSGKMDALQVEVDTLKPTLPIRFRRDPAELARIDPERARMRAKHPRVYYLDGLTAVFQPGVSIPGTLRVDQKFSGAEVVLLNPGPNAVEVLGILDRFPEIKCLNIIESSEKNIDAIRAELQKQAEGRALPEMAGYVTDLRHLPEELAGRSDAPYQFYSSDGFSDGRVTRQAKAFRSDHNKKSASAQMPSNIGLASPSPPVTKIWNARMFTMMGPRTSKPRFRVRGIMTRSPPSNSNTFTKVR